jgi:hypothetical protein
MSAGNRVGIGITDPQYTLDVAGDINITGGLFTNGQNASGSLYWSETAANNIVASTNVGIGITGEPVAPLHVGGDARIDGNLTVNGTQTVINTNVEETSRIEVTNNGTGPAMVVNQTGAQPVADFQDDGVSALFIADGGNIGIGMTNPSGNFNVAISGPTSFTNQPEGTIAFGNATSGVGAVMPTIQAKSNGINRIGLNLQSGTTNTNSNPDMRFNVRTSTNTDFETLTSRAFDFTRFTTPLMTILRNGNVGIGTTNPGNQLQVVGSATGNVARFMTNQATLSEISGVVIVANGGSANRRAGLVLDPNGGTGSGVNYGLLDYLQGGEFRMNNTLSTGFTTLFTNNTERMRITGNGNVGIGTTNPSQKLTIADSIGPFLRFDRTGTGSFDFEIGMPGSADLIFRGGADGTGSQLIEYMRITGNGNVGIGTTNPTEKLHVLGNARVTGKLEIESENFYMDRTPSQGRIGLTSSSEHTLLTHSIGNVEIAIDSNNNRTDRAFIVSHNAEGGGTELFRVQENGNVGIGTASPSQLLSLGPNGAGFPTPSGAAPLYACRAWVNFNGTGTPSIRASGNVSSVTRSGIGNYFVNFIISMPNTNYCCVSGQETAIGSPASVANQIGFRNYATTNINVTIDNSGNGSFSDKNLLNVAIFL